ncbi:sporulation protein RMD1 [Xylariomycetidae sp. FL0641]|nr:sporulation protein RMD1 [Xylariomycetidae sp. FL0641]
MAIKKHSRQYDLVVFGATGYTGLMVAEFVTTSFPTDLKWAVAGRSAEKLGNVVETCKKLNPDRKSPEVEICNLDDADLGALARKTFILITTVGPYAKYGEHAFKACAVAGTHYLDCTGEVVWQWQMIKRYDAAAKASGACLFPQSGIESAPSDLMTLAMASQIKSDLSTTVGDVVVDIHELRSAPSGGTLATAIGLFESFDKKEIVKSHEPFALSPVPNSKRAPKASLFSKLTGSYNVPGLGLLSTSITSGTNAAVVQRTWGLLQEEPGLRKYAYGPNFTYREFMKARNMITALAMHYGLIIGITLLMFCSPFRALLRKLVFQPGEGPSREDAAKEYIEFRGVASADGVPRKQALCKAWYTGSMYYPLGSAGAITISPASASSSSERMPLLRHDPSQPRPDTGIPRPARNVTFNPNPVTRTFDPEPSSLSSSPATPGLLGDARATGAAAPGTSPAGTPPMLSAINNRLRRRNSHGAVFTALPPAAVPKIGPQRSSKTAQKLKLLPNPQLDEIETDEESGRDVYSQYTRIKDPMARRDAARLGKADRDRLPRVTAYCTANRYQADGLMRFLKGRSKSRGANPKLIDECIYSPYNYSTGKSAERAEAVEEVRQRPVQAYERRHSTGEVDEFSNSYQRDALAELHAEHEQMDLEHAANSGRDANNDLAYPSRHDDETAIHDALPHEQHDADFDTHVHTPEVFLFDYGVVVIWGMSPAHEQRFLKDIAKFEIEKLEPDDVETECFNFYYTREYQPRIYNDFITLRDKNNYMTKLAISHALAQSVKTSLFEELIASTVDTCKDLPTQIATTGKIALSRAQINMQIGELFILRINIHLNGSVLDTPELFWVEPHLEPVYQAVRSYLEMDQRVRLLTERLDVIADLLAVLKDQLSHGHGEMLEWIVIILIAAEILVAAVNIVVDLYAGVD